MECVCVGGGLDVRGLQRSDICGAIAPTLSDTPISLTLGATPKIRSASFDFKFKFQTL